MVFSASRLGPYVGKAVERVGRWAGHRLASGWNGARTVVLEPKPFKSEVLGRESFKIKGFGSKNLVWAWFSEAR